MICAFTEHYISRPGLQCLPLFQLMLLPTQTRHVSSQLAGQWISTEMRSNGFVQPLWSVTLACGMMLTVDCALYLPCTLIVHEDPSLACILRISYNDQGSSSREGQADNEKQQIGESVAADA